MGQQQSRAKGRSTPTTFPRTSSIASIASISSSLNIPSIPLRPALSIQPASLTAPAVLSIISARDTAESSLLIRISQLPQELIDQILDHAGPLAKLLFGRLPLPLTKVHMQIVGAELIKLDALDRLQSIATKGHKLLWEIVFVRDESRKRILGMGLLFAVRAYLFFTNPTANLAEVVEAMRTQLDQLSIVEAQPLLPLCNEALDLIMGKWEISVGTATALSAVAAALGRLDALKALLSKLAESPDLLMKRKPFELAIKFRQTAVWQHLVSLGKADLVDISAAIVHGNLEATQSIALQFPKSINNISSTTVYNCLRSNGTRVLLWLIAVLDPKHQALQEIQDEAAAFGHLELLQRCITKHIGDPISTGAMDTAASFGRLDSLKWLDKNNHHCTWLAMDWAAREGHVEVVKWLHCFRREGCSHRAIDKAAEYGHVAVVKFLMKRSKYSCHRAALELCAQNGHVEIFRLLWDAYPDQRLSESDMKNCLILRHLWIVEYYLDQTHADAATARCFADLMSSYELHGVAECIRIRFVASQINETS